MKNKQLRQGDVFIRQISGLPTGATEKKRDKGDVILAYGEVTGHAHRIKSKRADLFELDGKTFLEVKPRSIGEETVEILRKADALIETIDGVLLSHEEHVAVTIPEGVYEIVIQQEYSDEGFRAVLD